MEEKEEEEGGGEGGVFVVEIYHQTYVLVRLKLGF